MLTKQKIYCVNTDCPFKQCDKHLRQLKKIKDKGQYVKVANLDSVCEDYLYYLLEEIEQGGA